MASFLTWCKDEGIIMPKIKFPTYFENGLIGVSCLKTIENREAYIFVPYKMMFTDSKVLENPELALIIDENKGENKLFNALVPVDPKIMTIVLGLFYEIAQGSQSYWYIYIRKLLDIHFETAWTQEELDGL